MTWVLVLQEYAAGFPIPETRTQWTLLVVADDATAKPIATFTDGLTARRCLELLRREGMTDVPLDLGSVTS